MMFLLVVPVNLVSQEILVHEKMIGGNIAVNLAFGTHYQRLGFNLNFFFISDFFQANSEIRIYTNFKNLGPGIKHNEFVLSQGIVFGYGRKNIIYNPFVNSVSNKTGYMNSFAYSYNAWFNKIRTKQQTGIIAFQFDKIAVIVENDILAKGYYDRFRTGGFLLQYQHEDKFQAALNCTMWTGQMGRQVHGDSSFKAPCYMDTTGGIYTQYSHGLLSAQLKYNTGYGQNLQANAGVDADQIRNTVQNKIIHDFIFIPRRWIKPKNCHIPMLDHRGAQYLFKKEQKIKKAKAYLNLFSNANLFY